MLVSGIEQSESVLCVYIYIYIYTYIFFSTIFYYKVLNIVPWDIQKHPVVHPFYVSPHGSWPCYGEGVF